MENKKSLTPSSAHSATATEEKFGSVMNHQQHELAAASVAASARAEVEAGYVLALRNPRNEELSRRRILDTCLNLKFAETALYNKPVGKVKKGNDFVQSTVEGLSIRFAEEAIRLWRNIKTLQTTVYDDPSKRIVKITVIDLESNVSYSKEFIIEKTVERKNAVGRDVISERINSYGDKISIVVATEDEIANKEAANASKTIRNNGLRVIPDHVLTEAMETIKSTVKAGIDKDPANARRIIVDNFAKINISVKQLEEYIKNPIDQLSTDQLTEFKGIFNAIKEGNTTWAEVVEHRSAEAKTAEVVDAGMPSRNAGENEWEYSDRIEKLRKEGKFTGGDASTHKSVTQPVK